MGHIKSVSMVVFLAYRHSLAEAFLMAASKLAFIAHSLIEEARGAAAYIEKCDSILKSFNNFSGK